jgi:hypothetical protein
MQSVGRMHSFAPLSHKLIVRSAQGHLKARGETECNPISSRFGVGVRLTDFPSRIHQ